MKNFCDLFNRYRDEMLGEEEKRQFESHLEVCEECGTRLMLLSNLVNVIRSQEIRDTAARSDQIADQAFERSDGWDAIFLSWRRPAQAWGGLAILLILLSFLWIWPITRQPAPDNEYESLLVVDDQWVSAIASLPDAEFELWLEQGGDSQ